MKRALLALGAMLAAAPAAAWEQQADGNYRSTTRIRAIVQGLPNGQNQVTGIWILTDDDAAAVCPRQNTYPRAITPNPEAAAGYIYVWPGFHTIERIYTQLLRLQSVGAPALIVISPSCELQAIQG